MELFPVALNWAEASDDELRSFIEAAADAAQAIGADPDKYVTDELTKAELLDVMRDGVADLEAARAELATREQPAEVVDEPAEPAAEAEVETDEFAELAAAAIGEDDGGNGDEPTDDDTEPGTEPDPEAAVELETPDPEPVTAAAEPAAPKAAPARRPLPRPARSTSAQPVEKKMPVTLTASAGAPGYQPGDELDMLEVARAMIRRRSQFGIIADGTHGEQLPIARFGWEYPADRRLGDDIAANMALIASVTDPDKILAAFEARRAEGSLTASGGLCAPVTPYYNLQMVSVADRPVRGALPGFNADRGGLRFAAPASIAAVTDGVGIRTTAEDYAGGTEGAKTCQVIDCPSFTEQDVDIIFHCLQFGNLGARAFPELVAQWNNLVLAAHARTAETNLLDGINSSSTQVTAGDIDLGGAATFLGELRVAAAAMRNRHRMDPNAVLRMLAPRWLLDLLVSDQVRSQFGRYEMDAASFVGEIRKANVEPTFYIDGPTGASQVFGTQSAAKLLAFPSTTKWFLYPEGSFIYLDGGTLELGLVRDSVLNEANDFQMFGESFEQVAFVGVESIAVTSNICDSGVVAAPHTSPCPIDYA